MVKEKTLGPPEVGDLEQAILKAFYGGLMQPQHEQDATGRRRFVFDVEILIETGSKTAEPAEEVARAGTPVPSGSGRLEQALIRSFCEGLLQPERDEATPRRRRLVFEIDITVEDGRLVHAAVKEVAADERRPTAERLH
jgi:hypothetical protein